MIKKMSNKAYHASKGLSKSMMDKLNKSPAHFKYWQEHPEEPTEAMVMGSLLHTLLLERKLLNKEYALMPDINKRTNEGKQAYADFLEQNKGKQIITKEQLELANQWARAIKNHPIAGKYFQPKTGKNEVSIFWNDKETGELCKARLDRMVDNVIIDLKTAISAQQDDFQRKAYDLGYHRQAAWFKEAYEQEFNKELDKFLFIVVEKTAPYSVVVYDCDLFMLEIGAKENRELLQKYHECKLSNNWYGYDGETNEIQKLGLPNYVVAKNMEEI